MRKLLIVVMFLTVLFTYSEKVEASSVKQNKLAIHYVNIDNELR